MERAHECDVLVIGGGVIGIAIALEVTRRQPDARVTLVEKEAGCGAHASGRNSGVLHAGFYYTADSLKARFCRDGNAELTEYCARRGLRINRCGKLVVAADAGELASLDELLRRGRTNGVPLEDLDERAARAIEPRARTHRRALFSPTTSSVDPTEVMAALERDARDAGVQVLTGTPYRGRVDGGVRAGDRTVRARFVMNAAGLYADRIARDFGFGDRWVILPFKGLYLYSSEPPGSLRTHVYPVPDLKYPFLGVHYTVTIDGRLKIGPTAVPAFWREHYEGVGNFRLGEFAEVVIREAGLMLRAGFDFRSLAVREIRKYWRPHLVRQAARLLEGVRQQDYVTWGRPGIRAQLLDLESRRLEMDFVLEGDGDSLHVLNAVSPAFTCALPFARHVCDRIPA